MIFIDRMRVAIPPTLADVTAATERVCTTVEALPPARRVRLPRDTFERDLWGAAEVKDALKEMQHRKCAFCESLFDHIAFGDVEHFRPKAACKQAVGARVQRGYYWLAYTWTNLLVACEVCNRRHKRDLFPLVNDAERVTSHIEAHLLVREAPLFVNPADEDPQQHIAFRDEVPYPRTSRGRVTLHRLALGRPELADRRQERVQRARFFIELLRRLAADPSITQFDDLAKEAAQWLSHATQPESEYASMVRCLLADRLGANPAGSVPCDEVLSRAGLQRLIPQ